MCNSSIYINCSASFWSLTCSNICTRNLNSFYICRHSFNSAMNPSWKLANSFCLLWIISNLNIYKKVLLGDGMVLLQVRFCVDHNLKIKNKIDYIASLVLGSSASSSRCFLDPDNHQILEKKFILKYLLEILDLDG